MSKAGNFTAYQQYKPKDNGTIEAIQHWSNFYEQKKQNDQAQKQRDNELQFRIDKEKADQIDKWSESPKIDLTGVANLDQFKAKAMSFFMEQRYPIVEKLVSTKQGSPEYIETMMKFKKMDQFASQLNTITSNEIEDAKKYNKGKGKEYVRTPEADAAFESTLNPEIIYNQKTGDFAFMMPDADDPTKKVPVTAQQYLNGEKPFKLMPRYDDEKWTAETIKTLKQKIPVNVVYDENSNSYIKTTGYDKETDIIPYVRTSLFEDEKPTEIGYSFAAELGYKPKDMLDPTIQENIVKHYTDRLSPALADGIEKKWDDKRAMFTIKKKQIEAKIDNDKAKLQQGLAKINLKSQELIDTGKIQSVPDPNVDFVTKSNQNGKPTFGVNIAENKFSIVNKNEDVKVEQQIRDIKIDPKANGKVIISGTIYEEVPGDYSGKKPAKEEFTFDSSTAEGLAQVEKVAAHLKMNRQQLYDLIKARMPKQQPTTKPTTKPKTKRKATDYGL